MRAASKSIKRRAGYQTETNGMSDAPVCLVIGPIGTQGSDIRRAADLLLHAIIEPAVAAVAPTMNVIRSDKISDPGDINKQVIRLLMTVPLVICDMTNRNANAFYELGVRHSVGLPCVHLNHKTDVFPFDVATMRAAVYSPDDIEGSRQQLEKYVRSALSPQHLPENPIIDIVSEFGWHSPEYDKLVQKIWDRGCTNLFAFLSSAYANGRRLIPDNGTKNIFGNFRLLLIKAVEGHRDRQNHGNSALGGFFLFEV
jgi:hypothetical protein